MIAIALLFWTMDARIVRGNILFLRESEYMQAARATGIKPINQVFRHLIPNTLPSIIVSATLGLGGGILLESTLSF
jgi:peptide/nickel transport system permease protein